MSKFNAMVSFNLMRFCIDNYTRTSLFNYFWVFLDKCFVLLPCCWFNNISWFINANGISFSQCSIDRTIIYKSFLHISCLFLKDNWIFRIFTFITTHFDSFCYLFVLTNLVFNILCVNSTFVIFSLQ